MNAVNVTNLTKRYNNHLAVDHISFQVDEGELFAFLGENGAGKSTTINMLSTILQMTEGEVKIFGHQLGKEDDEIRSEIGIVFQNSVLDGKLTVKENIMTRGSYYGYSKKRIMERMEDFWEPFSMEEIWNQRYEQLSGGQRRRVDIVRALLHKPRLLFLDEPTTGLDPMSRKIVWDYIDYLRKEEKLTIFLTTHYMEETKDADHVVIMDKGHIIAEGTPAELKSTYAKTRVVWYCEESETNAAMLQGYHYRYDVDHYQIWFDQGITRFLAKHEDVVTDYEVIKGSMDDVFLTLTGKEMKNE